MSAEVFVGEICKTFSTRLKASPGFCNCTKWRAWRKSISHCCSFAESASCPDVVGDICAVAVAEDLSWVISEAVVAGNACPADGEVKPRERVGGSGSLCTE